MGVPQGSVLRPLLFLIYINDLDDNITSNVLKFADDTKVFRKVNTDGDKQHLQNDLDRLVKWQMLLSPLITLDFEQAVINAVMSSFGPQVNVHGCFYHLTQATWRKIQTLGIVQRYREEEDVKLFCGMLDGLAFLPVDDVPEGMTYLREHTPEGLEPLLDYFDNTYVSGAFRRIQPPQHPDGSMSPLRMRRMPPMYPPPIWNVNSITLEGGSRTNNICEGWNNAFAKLVGHAHPTIWRAIDSIRKDQAQVATALLRDLRGEPPAKRVRRHTHKLQSKLHKLCTDRRDNSKTVPDVLKGIGHCVRFK